jgi:quinoprotein glucose dehydrogenase
MLKVGYASACPAAALALLAASSNQPPYTSWSDYGGSADSMRYSALNQITRTNVNQLELAWFRPTPGPPSAFNPLVIDGVLYALGADNAIVAMDAATGNLIWTHPVTFGKDGRAELREGLDRDPKTIRGIQSKNHGRVFENLVIMGSATGDDFGPPPDDVRVYDMVDGKMVWSFHTTPRPGEFGYDTSPPQAYKYAGGGANVDRERQ